MINRQRILTYFSLLLLLVVLVLCMLGPAQVLAVHEVQAQDAHTRAGSVALDGTVFTRTRASGSSISVSHTIGTGDNRLMPVGVSANSYGAARTISSVTFTSSGGTATSLAVGGSGTSPFDLPYSATPVASTFADLLSILTVDDDRVVESPAAEYTLTVAVSPIEGGTTKPTVGAHIYTEGTVVDVTATPTTGYTFTSWSGACTGSGACSVTMDADKTVRANFTLITYELTVAVDPVQGGTTFPAAGVHTYFHGAVVDVTATPNTGYQFDHWTGACFGTGTCKVTMNANKTVTAHFTSITYVLTMAADPIGAGMTDPAVGVHPYAPETVVNVTATPNSGYALDHWSGACTGTGACQVTMNAHKTVMAHFSGITYNLTVAVDPVEGGTTNPAVGVHAYAYGIVADVTAAPAGGYKFDHWSGACTGTGACQVTMNIPRSVTANFTKLPPDLSLTKADGGEAVSTGDTISYLLTYANAGGNAAGVVINETVPANTAFNSAASTSGWVCQPNGNAGSSCSFNLGQVANAGGSSVIFAVTAIGPLPRDVTEISNTAGIGDDGSGGVDSNPTNNTASAHTTIIKLYLNYLPLTSKDS